MRLSATLVPWIHRHRFAATQHRVPEFGVVHLGPLVMLDVPLPAEIQRMISHNRLRAIGVTTMNVKVMVAAGGGAVNDTKDPGVYGGALRSSLRQVVAPTSGTGTVCTRPADDIG